MYYIVIITIINVIVDINVVTIIVEFVIVIYT